jgi:hypothetical protein
MAKFYVGFDGRWQETFDDFNGAAIWAREVAESGRRVVVAERRFLTYHFCAGFPEEQAAEVKSHFRRYRAGGAAGAGSY